MPIVDHEPEDEDDDWMDAEEDCAVQGSLPHHPSWTIFTWLMPRLPWFHAHVVGNEAHVPRVSAVLQIPDQYETENPTRTNAVDDTGSSTSVYSNEVDLEHVLPVNTNPPHLGSN